METAAMAVKQQGTGIEPQAADAFYAEAEIQRHKIEDATIAVRVFGKGPALVLIHGYPLHGYTWRLLLPTLAASYTCYVIDLPGLGDSDWTDDTDISFTAQARRLSLLFESLQLQRYALMAHDTGATLARMVALLQPERVEKLVLFNTEIPDHRPPWIPFYQLAAKLPFAASVFGLLLRSDRFVRSPMVLGQFYFDRELFHRPGGLDPYFKRLTSSSHRMDGMLRYLQGIEWDVIDDLRIGHADIKAETLLLWGENDKTFPVELAEEMCEQFSSKTQFVRIPSASLMPHEERPAEVLEHLVRFLSDSTAALTSVDRLDVGIAQSVGS